MNPAAPTFATLLVGKYVAFGFGTGWWGIAYTCAAFAASIAVGRWERTAVVA